MSGGSYDYLYSTDTIDLFNKKEAMRAMLERLNEFGYAEEAANDTKKLLLLMSEFEEQAEQLKSKLEHVWKAVEWFQSSDSDETRVIKTLEHYPISNSFIDE